jgi:hypothetical protein
VICNAFFRCVALNSLPVPSANLFVAGEVTTFGHLNVAAACAVKDPTIFAALVQIVTQGLIPAAPTFEL